MKSRKKYTLETILKLLTIPLFPLVLGGYHATPVTTKNSSVPDAGGFRSAARQNDSLQAVVQFLLNASATDFRKHQPPVPVGFRKVKVGYLLTSNGGKQYVLCGRFLPSDKKEWTLFATVKTSDYEQWIGSQALPFCQNPDMKWVKLNDLSSALKNRLDSLR